MSRFTPRTLLMLTTLGLALAGCAAPSVVTYKATLTGANEVPPVATAATGQATMTLDISTKTFTWSVTYAGLSSTAVAAHIHGPAAPGANAGVLINLVPNGRTIDGSMTLTDQQISLINSGVTYVNIHTVNNKGGEIRGQIGFAR